VTADALRREPHHHGSVMNGHSGWVVGFSDPNDIEVRLSGPSLLPFGRARGAMNSGTPFARNGRTETDELSGTLRVPS
jgi:hypothetical protein